MPSNWKSCFIFLLFFIAQTAVAQDSNRLQKAFAFSKNGRYEQAAIEFTSILRKDSTNAEALEGRAFNALRSKHFSQAEFDFLKLLRLQPNNLSAENGLAEALAGQKRYADAIDIFDNVILKTNKTTDTLNNIEALRGKGYANFNRQHYYDALKVFLLLSQEFGDKQEYLTYIAKIYTALQQQYDARRTIKQLRKTNSDSGFNDLEYAVQSSPAFAEVSLLGGYSQVGGANKFGANGAEAVIRPAHNFEFYGEYDNGLGRDILSIIKNNIPQFSVYSGGSYSIGRKNNFLTTLEFGHRHYSNHSFQRSFKVEEVISLVSFSLKGGYIYAPKSDHIPDCHPTKEYLCIMEELASIKRTGMQRPLTIIQPMILLKVFTVA